MSDLPNPPSPPPPPPPHSPSSPPTPARDGGSVTGGDPAVGAEGRPTGDTTMLDAALAAATGRARITDDPHESRAEFRRYVWQRRWFQTLLAVLVVFLVLSFVLPGVLGLLYEVRSVLVPVLIGLALAYIANPLLRWAERRLRIGRLAGTISLMLLALVIVAAVLPPAFGLLRQQGGDLIRNAQDVYPRYVDKLLATLEKSSPTSPPTTPSAPADPATTTAVPPADSPSTSPPAPPPATPSAEPAAPVPVPTSDASVEIEPAERANGSNAAATEAVVDPPPAQAVEKTADPDAEPAEDETLVEAVVEKIIDPNRNRQLLELAADQLRQIDGQVIARWALQSLDIGVGLVGSAISFTSYLLLAAVVVAFCFFFFSWKFDSVLRWFKPYIPQTSREHTIRMLAQMDLAVSSFVRGRLIQSLVMMVVLVVGWYLVGVPYWFLLGVLTGVLNVVPFLPMVGWLVAVALTVMTALAGGGGPGADAGQAAVAVADSGFRFGLILWPTLIYFIAQGLDGWVIEPVVQGKATNLDPLTVMLVVLIGGSLLGLAGMLLAIPLAACVKILMQEMVLPRLKTMASEN